MGKGRQGVDVGKEVVDKQDQDAPRRNGLGIQGGMRHVVRRDGDQGLGSVVRGGRHARLGIYARLFCELGSFGVFVGWTASLGLPLKGALEVEQLARTAGGAGVIALHAVEEVGSARIRCIGR